MEAKEGEEVPLELGLSLIPRHELHFTFFRRDNSPLSLDEWQLKETLLDAFKRHAGLVLKNERDLRVQKDRDIHKRRKDECVATAVLDLSVQCTDSVREKSFERIEEKMRKVEIRVSGNKLLCETTVPPLTTFVSLQQRWEEEFGPNVGGYKSQRPGDRPDTLHIKGIPSRWLAEPRVSSNPSLLVTHSLFSVFGAIRKLEVLGDADVSKAAREVGDLASGGVGARLRCEVVVQFEDYGGFCEAVRAWAGRALKKEGSKLVATYTLECDVTDFFSDKNVRRRRFDKQREEDEVRRRELEEQRRKGIEAQKAELARLEEERKLAEEREQMLREEEEKIREEEEERLRLEEEERREEEKQRLLEEERQQRVEWEEQQEKLREEEQLRKEEEEAERREQEERMAMEEELRAKEEQKVRLLEEARRLRDRQREETDYAEKRAKENSLRKQVEERMRERRDQEQYNGFGNKYGNEHGNRNEYGNRNGNGSGNRYGNSNADSRVDHRFENEDENDISERWPLDGTQSAASIESLTFLKRSAVILTRTSIHTNYGLTAKRQANEKGTGREGEERLEGGESKGEEGEEGGREEREVGEYGREGKELWSYKRLRSTVVSVS